jgi:hypothetical protein
MSALPELTWTAERYLEYERISDRAMSISMGKFMHLPEVAPIII